MSESDIFLARWLRLKQEAGKVATPAAPLDLASLPPIESLTCESDLKAFLQTGVPTDMVRAALRTVWRVDPNIRDFVGIAESQWDFNDPNAMPGFGPLEEAMDSAPSVVTRSAAPTASAAEATLEAAPNLNPQRDGQLDPVWLSGEPGRQGMVHVSGVDYPRQAELERSDAQVPGAPRRHGGALPKPI
jgi:Protein of unknown function (DUF3306)